MLDSPHDANCSEPTSSPSSQLLGSDSVFLLALELMAKSHDRDRTLQVVLLRWKDRAEGRQRQRRRQELVAEGFFGHRLQFTTFRAWQWELQERQRNANNVIRADTFRSTWDSKLFWLAWLRFHRVERRKKQSVGDMVVRHRWRVVHCCHYRGGMMVEQPAHIPHEAQTRGSMDSSCCRWHAWQRRARLSLTTRQVAERVGQQRRQQWFIHWVRAHLFDVRPRQIFAAEQQRRLIVEGSLCAHHAWLVQAHTTRLLCWHRAVTSLRDVMMPTVFGALLRRVYTQWRRGAAQRVLAKRTAIARLTLAYRRLFAFVVACRSEHHLEQVADEALTRRWLRHWAAQLNTVKAHNKMVEDADAMYDAHWAPRTRRLVLALWSRRVELRRRRAAHLKDVLDVRQSLLIGLALRRLGDAAPPPPQVRNTATYVHDGRTHTHAATSPQTRSQEDAMTTSLTPLPTMTSLTPLLHSQFASVLQVKPIPLSSPLPSSSLSMPAGGGGTSPSPSRILQSPQQHNDDARSGLRTASAVSFDTNHRGLAGSTPTKSSIDSRKVGQLQQLLERYHEAHRSANADKAAFRELTQRRNFVLERQRTEIGQQLLTKQQERGISDATQLPNAPPTHSQQELTSIEAQLRLIRQRTETRAALRSQIVMLRREVGACLEGNIAVAHVSPFLSGGAAAVSGGGLQWLDTPRSDASFR